MAKAEDDLLGNAIIETEKEIASGAWDEEPGALDPTGDRSLEEMGDGLEGQHEDDEEEETEVEAVEPKEGEKVETEAKTETEPKKGEVIPPEPQGRVPAGRLREEAERARAAIAERDTFKAQLDAEKASNAKALGDLNAKFEAFLAGQKAPPKPAEETPKPKIPDLFEDPNAFAEHLNRGVQERFDAFQRQQRDREVNASIDSARTRHGETFATAWKALETLPKSPETVQLVQRLEAASNPGEAIVSWHKRNVAAREVGDDLEGYKARIAEETRKQLAADPEFHKELLASLRGEAEIGDQGRPRTAVRLPPALARAAGGNSRGLNDDSILDGSDQSIAESAWR
jgi:hypothetical protein